MRKRLPRLPVARAAVRVERAAAPHDAEPWYGPAAIRARGLAAELTALADRMVASDTDENARRDLAEEVTRISWAIRGYQRDTAMRLAFVFAIEHAIAHLEQWRAAVVRARIDRGEPLSTVEATWSTDLRTTVARSRLAMPYRSPEAAASVIALGGWLTDATFGTYGRATFAGEWPREVRRISVEDCELAARALRGEAQPKWSTLAALLAARFPGREVRAETLEKYVRRFRARFER